MIHTSLLKIKNSLNLFLQQKFQTEEEFVQIVPVTEQVESFKSGENTKIAISLLELTVADTDDNDELPSAAVQYEAQLLLAVRAEEDDEALNLLSVCLPFFQGNTILLTEEASGSDPKQQRIHFKTGEHQPGLLLSIWNSIGRSPSPSTIINIQLTDLIPSEVIHNSDDHIPFFIGYLPAPAKGNGLEPFKLTYIESLDHFQSLFESPYSLQQASFFLEKHEQKPATDYSYVFNGDIYTIEPDPGTVYYLQRSIELYFANGGENMVLVSLGNYGPASGAGRAPDQKLVNPNIRLEDFKRVLDQLKTFKTLASHYVIPDATLLPDQDYAQLIDYGLKHCSQLQSPILLLDIPEGREPQAGTWETDITAFRKLIRTSSNSRYGVTFYPFLNSQLNHKELVSYESINGGQLHTLEPLLNSADHPNEQAQILIKAIADGQGGTVAENNAELAKVSKTYQGLLLILREKINIIPPSALMAGLYAKKSPAKGIFNFPDDLELNGVKGVTLEITEEKTKFLAVDPLSGFSINPIQLKPGFGKRMQMARTLAGNDDQWRYLIIRDHLLWIKRGLSALRWSARAVSSNIILTNLKHAIEAHLTSIWMQGGLAGSNSREAFSVKVAGPNSSPENAGEQNISAKISLNMGLKDSAPFPPRVINVKVPLGSYVTL